MRFISFDCIANREEEHTRRESILLFNKAKDHIKIIAGDPNNDFYNDERVVNALKGAINKGVDVQVAYFPIAKKHEKPGSATFQIPKIRVWTLKTAPQRHMSVIDGKHVRIERRHPLAVRQTPAIICKNAPLLARDVESIFTTLIETK